MRSSGGLTLVEVVLAILILAVGIIGAGALQANGLRATRTSQIVQELDAEARSAITTLRSQYGAGATSVPQEIEADCLERYSEICTFAAVPCALSGSSLVCSPGTAGPVAWAITVTAADQDHEVVLNTIVMAE